MAWAAGAPARAGDQPVAIFHAFDQSYTDVAGYVCEVAAQGYSHIQISPAQQSNPSDQWWARYQPVDYTVIAGKGTSAQLKAMIAKAHGCGIKVIADVVFNHMASMPQYQNLSFPHGIVAADFHPRCDINYNDGNRDTEVNCWLGSLPDLDQTKPLVMSLQKKHLKLLLDLGIDGFRFDAAKHMPAATVQKYIDYVNSQNRNTWNYLEVIEDHDTPASAYTPVASVEDFVLYGSMKNAFTLGGDLRTLRVPTAVDDPRSVTFGRNHDNVKEINDSAINPYNDKTDSYLATAYVLAREGGTPLVLNWDNADVPFIRTGVRFRQIMRQRGNDGGSVKENVLAVVNSDTLLVMERGSEGFFVVNKAASVFNVDTLDMTLTNLEGCYRELRYNFLVSIERRTDGKKWVTRWGSRSRGGMQVQPRDAIYLTRTPWSDCQAN
ncbi:MAG TPA: alpha-amylase family glycosyl hydrolase [Polyangia bacterium]|nr:alpha-amylase family glycosyl hydrolase [Polyangia bacterium]